MFGYVRAFKPELKVCEYDAYKAVYCSLCHRLGHNFGPFARFTLNYDFVFMTLLLLGISEACPGFKKTRCPFAPTVKCNKLDKSCSEMDFVADAAMIMMYYKLKDGLHDEKFFKKIPLYLSYPLFASARKGAARRQPQLDGIFNDYIERQNLLEASKTPSIDEICEPSADVLAKTAAMCTGDAGQSRILSRIGYCVGKWVYLADALDDLKGDIKSGSYNVIAVKYGLDSPESAGSGEHIRDIISQMNVCICEAVSAFELLKINRFRGIIENILYKGLPRVQTEISERGKTVNEGSV